MTTGVALVEAFGWSLAAISVLVGLVQIVPLADTVAVIGFLVAPATALVFLALWGIWRAGDTVAPWVPWLLFGTAALTVLMWSAGTWLREPGYATDAVAFNELAAGLLLEGRNPYGADLSGALDRFGVPPTFVTLTLDGGVVQQLSYPAGSILPVAALLALGVPAQAANVVDVLAWLAALALMTAVLPRALRWLPVALAGSMLLAGMVAGGVTDPVYLVPLILALRRWNSFAVDRTGVQRWVGPLMLGVACAVKQLPWFFAPFLLIGIYLEARRSGKPPIATAARYAGVAAAAFFAINGPFIVWDPGAWLAGTLLPLVQPLIPDGQGLAGLVVQAGVGGGDLGALGVAGLAGYTGLLALFVARYEKWRAAWPILVIAAFLLAARSLSSYLLMALPAVLVALTTLPAAPLGSAVPRSMRRVATVVTVAALAASGLAVGVALVTPQPLDIRIVEARGTGARQTVAQVVAEVTNRSDTPLTPRYTVSVAGKHSGWWDESSGGGEIPAGQSRVVVLSAPGEPAMPGARARFVVTAFTAGPGTVSTSASGRQEVVSLALTPSAVPSDVPVGAATTFHLELRDALGRPLPRAGVPVAISQVVFAPTGVLPGPASIDGEPAGQSPVIRRTGADGALSFTVTGVAALRDPVYIQAWIADDPENPRSFSNLTSIRFSTPDR